MKKEVIDFFRMSERLCVADEPTRAQEQIFMIFKCSLPVVHKRRETSSLKGN